MKIEFSQQVLEQSVNMKFHDIPSNGSRVAACGRRDMTKLNVAFLSFCERA